MKRVDWIAKILILIGALNWGMVGIFDVDVIDVVFNKVWLDRLIYALIGFSALYRIVNWQSQRSSSH